MSKESKAVVKGSTDWISRIFALASLCISASALWYSFLAPADIRVTLSSPSLRWQGVGAQSTLGGVTWSSTLLMVRATCAFSNNGPRVGEVSGLALLFEADDGTKWTAGPNWIFDETKIGTEEELTAPFKGPFSWIVLPGKQTAAHTYLFIVETPDAKPVNLRPHKFHVTVFTWSPGDDKPRKQQQSTLDLNENVLSVLSGSTQFVDLHFDEEYEMMHTIVK